MLAGANKLLIGSASGADHSAAEQPSVRGSLRTMESTVANKGNLLSAFKSRRDVQLPCAGTITPPNTVNTTYKFGISSDDASSLYIDGFKIANDSGGLPNLPARSHVRSPLFIIRAAHPGGPAASVLDACLDVATRVSHMTAFVPMMPDIGSISTRQRLLARCRRAKPSPCGAMCRHGICQRCPRSRNASADRFCVMLGGRHPQHKRPVHREHNAGAGRPYLPGKLLPGANGASAGPEGHAACAFYQHQSIALPSDAV